MLVRTIKALCEINIRFDHKLEISGSLHVRSDGDKVMTCLIDEESIKGAQDLSILDAVRFTMPYAAAALAPMAMQGGYSQQSAQLTEALMSPMAAMPQVQDKDDKHVTSNGSLVMGRGDPRDNPQVVNIVPMDLENTAHQMDMSSLTVINNKTPEMPQLSDNVTTMLMQRRHSHEGAPRAAHEIQPTPATIVQKEDSSKPTNHGSKPTARAKPSHSNPSQSHATMLTNAGGQPPDMVQTGQPVSNQNLSNPAQNHVKLPNIQTFAGMHTRLPQIKTESREPAASPLPRTTDTPSFPSPPQNLATSPLSSGYAVDPLAGVKVEVQSQVDSDGNVIQKKKYQCMFCGIFLSTKCYLKNHINAMHTKARVYPCEVCEKYFYSAGALRIHKLRNHWQGSKKHKCDHCGETFLLPIELRKHLMKKHAEMDDFDTSPGSSSIGGLPRSTTDPNTAPSSGSSSPRVYIEKSMFPAASFAQTMQTMTQSAMMHGSPVFPMPIPHTADALHKDLLDAAAAAANEALDTDLRVTQGTPVFPSPVPQSIAHTGASKAITTSFGDASTE